MCVGILKGLDFMFECAYRKSDRVIGKNHGKEELSINASKTKPYLRKISASVDESNSPTSSTVSASTS